MQDTTPYSGLSARMVTSPPSSMRGSTPPTGREPQKAAVQHLGNKKADLVEMRVQQDGFRALFTAGQAADHVAVLIRIHGVAVRRNSSATAFAACISKPLTAGSAHSVRSVCSNCKEIPPFSSFIVQGLL